MSSSLARMVRHALTMMVGTLASRLLGLAREMVTAALFGATRQLDAFFIAYTLANLSRQLLAEGALSAAFVPVFSQVLVRDGRDRARSLACQAMTVLAVAGVAVVAAGFLLAPLLVRLMAPGFSTEESALALGLTRQILPFLLLMSLSALAMGVLNSMDRFFVPSLAPALSNVVYLVVLLAFFRLWAIWALPVAVLCGGLVQFLLQWFWAGRLGVLLLPARPDRRDRDLRRMFFLFFPYAAGLSLNQVNPIVSRMLGSFLEEGAISVLNYADRILQLPLGLFVIAISQAVLPLLARHVLDGEEIFAEVTRDALRFALFIVLPVSAGLFLVSDEMVHLLFRRGAFDDWAWHATSQALSMYALGLPGMALTTVIMRALYARGLPRDALFVTASSVGANLLFCLLLMGPLSYRGLALASSLAFAGAAAVGYHRLCGSLGRPLKLLRWSWLARLLPGLVALVAVVVLFRSLCPYSPTARLSLRAAWVLSVTVAGGGVYGLATALARAQEWNWLSNACRKDDPS